MEHEEYARQRLDAGIKPSMVMRELKERWDIGPSQGMKTIQKAAGAPDGAVTQPPRHIREFVWSRDGRECQYCSTTEAKTFILEHVVPVVRGGISEQCNLVVACASCNTKKRSNVWIPKNIDYITRNRPDWRARINSMCDENAREKPPIRLHASDAIVWLWAELESLVGVEQARILREGYAQRRHAYELQVKFTPAATEETVVAELVGVAAEEMDDDYQRRADSED